MSAAIICIIEDKIPLFKGEEEANKRLDSYKKGNLETVSEKDFFELSRKQLKILSNASKLVKSGGRIIYSTCSLEHEENEAVATEFLRLNAEFEKIAPELDEKFMTDENFARTFPPRDETDGFFIAVFRKK